MPTLDFHISITELAERVFSRMSIGVTLSNLDDSIFRHDLTKEGVAGAGIAAMVPDLQDRCGKVVSGVQDIRFGGSLSIARKQEGCLPIYNLHHDGSVIGVLIALLRPQDGHRGAAQGECIPRLRNRNRDSLLANTYRNLLSLLTLGSMHRESLLMRGLSGDAIDQLGYRTTPAVRSGRIVAELLERGCELEGVPGFYRDRETGSWKLDIRASGIMIPDRNMLGEIEAIQIRLDRPYKSKFNNLTSVDKYYGTTASCCPHFAGPHDSDAVYLTEGVMKADIAQYLSNALGQPRCFIGLTGVGNINQFRRLLKELATVHINRIIVAFDMDALINENVRNARQRVLQEGSDAGFEMTPIAWDEKYKGIDDLLLSFKEARAS